MAARRDVPVAALASLVVLFQGYAGGRGASTVTYIRDGDARVIVNLGMVPSPAAILGPLRALGESPEAISDVVCLRCHPGHALNAALFPAARFHDCRAIYQGGRVVARHADGFLVSPSIRLIATAGHTPHDITTLVGTGRGIAACTRLWWDAHGPADDPTAADPDAWHAGRARVLQVATLIVPAHGPPFIPGPTTPR